MLFALMICSSSAQPLQPKFTFSNGGARSSGASSVNIGIVGQSFIGTISNTGSNVSAGFLSGGDISIDATVSITASDFPETHVIGSSGTTVSITVNDPSLVSNVDFLSRGLSSPGATFGVQSNVQVSTAGTYSVTLTDTDFAQDIGVAYQFDVTSSNSTLVSSTTGVTYAEISADNQSLGALQFGRDVSNYQIISIPYILNDRSVLGIFNELAPYDNTKWRLFNYSGGQTNEFNTFTNIDIGKGYWLIVAEQTTITLGAGIVPQVSPTTPFDLTLEPGWNQIGNPFLYSIDWASVLAENANPSGIGNLFQLSGSTLGQSNTLAAFRGGFVENTSGAAVTIQLPASKDAIGARVSGRTENEALKNSLADDSWEVPLILTDGKVTNTLGGIGMRMDAELERDRYDVSRFPTPFDLAEIIFELKSGNLSRNVVATSESHIWDFEIGGVENQQVVLHWDNSYFGDNYQELVLIDLGANRKINMRTVDELTINTGVSSKFQILYGDIVFIDNNALPASVSLGDVYPNPFVSEVTIPFTLPGQRNLNYDVNMSLFDLNGRETSNVYEGTMGAGFHTIQWNRNEIAEGIYHLVMKVNGNGQEWKMNKKLIIK